MSVIKKAIIPVAGLGTRFLPATKAQPKEMLTLVDKPVIQHIVEEAVESGIEQIIFVTSATKRAIEDHFDRNFELEYRLRQKNKRKELGQILDISDLCTFAYVRQRSPKGDGHAILSAADFISDEPVAVMFGDDVIDTETPVLKQLMNCYETFSCPIIGIQEVDKTQTERFGIIDGSAVDERTYRIRSLVEKPKAEDAPSNLAIIGRYIITPEIVHALATADFSGDGELRLIDAFRSLVDSRAMYGHKFEGVRYDCGNKLDFMRAAVEMGVQHEEIGEAFQKYLREREQDSSKKDVNGSKTKSDGIEDALTHYLAKQNL